jgi:hypothetical protein
MAPLAPSRTNSHLKSVCDGFAERPVTEISGALGIERLTMIVWAVQISTGLTEEE